MVQVSIRKSDTEHVFEARFAWTTFDGSFRADLITDLGIDEIVQICMDPDEILVHDASANRDLVNADILDLYSVARRDGGWTVTYKSEDKTT